MLRETPLLLPYGMALSQGNLSSHPQSPHFPLLFRTTNMSSTRDKYPSSNIKMSIPITTLLSVFPYLPLARGPIMGGI